MAQSLSGATNDGGIGQSGSFLNLNEISYSVLVPKSSDKVSLTATVDPVIKLLYLLAPVVLHRVKVNVRADSSNSMKLASRPAAVSLVVMALAGGRA